MVNKREKRRELASRIVFVGCQVCGATDRPLRNYGDGKICPTCLERQSRQRVVSKMNTRRE